MRVRTVPHPESTNRHGSTIAQSTDTLDDVLRTIPGDRPAEDSSKVTPELQAADVAAYHARTLYDEHGLKAVCDEFRCVIHNAALVRDWQQSEAGRPPRGTA